MLTFKKTNELPEKNLRRKRADEKTNWKPLQRELWLLYTALVVEDYAHAEVLWSEQEYTNMESCYGSLYRAIKTSGLPLTICIRDGRLFISRRSLLPD